MNRAAQEAEVLGVIRTFLEAFDCLDWPVFEQCFHHQVSLFFPFEDTPQRVSGKKHVLARFAEFFEATRRSKTGPKYLGLEPRDLHMNLTGNAAIVTFHLVRDSDFSRRTVVLEKVGQEWRILHLHASRIDTSGSSPA